MTRSARHLRTPRSRRRLAGALTMLLASVGAVTSLLVPAATAPAHAANLAAFEPGYIMSDAIFWDRTTMSAPTIQAFLYLKGAACRPGDAPCLKDYRQATGSRDATAMCARYEGSPDESAAEIIAKVAQACGVNPQVIITILQKEEGLVTGSTGSGARLRTAMGYGCPDTAVCDALYFGFFNQVYSAASRFRYYAQNPAKFSHQVGVVNHILLKPNSTCGTADILIKNQATAGLYNYTPYAPNAAALAAGTGLGDACSSYGNRNFWNYFTDWFGPTTQRAPFGALDVAAATPAGVVLGGWALDPDTVSPILVHVYVDGAATAVLTAAGSRPDVGGAFGKGDDHGFAATLPVGPGPHNICVYAIDSSGGANALVACRTLVVVNTAPMGAVDAVRDATDAINVVGWALDPDTANPIAVHVYIDGSATPVLANVSRPDVGAAHHDGDGHGFNATIPATPGDHTVCIYAIDSAGGANPLLACRAVHTYSAPFGSFESASSVHGALAVVGWALDLDTTDPIWVHVYVDDVATAVLANGSRPDVGAAHHDGDGHGFTATLPASAGTHNVCVYGISVPAGSNRNLGCRTVVVTNAAPIGALDQATGGTGSVTTRGWALDPDTTNPITVHVYVDSSATPVTANASRPDVAAAFHEGSLHGFTATIATPAGTHEVCAYAINTPAGDNPVLGCRSVQVG